MSIYEMRATAPGRWLIRLQDKAPRPVRVALPFIWLFGPMIILLLIGLYLHAAEQHDFHDQRQVTARVISLDSEPNSKQYTEYRDVTFSYQVDGKQYTFTDSAQWYEYQKIGQRGVSSYYASHPGKGASLGAPNDRGWSILFLMLMFGVCYTFAAAAYMSRARLLESEMHPELCPA